MFRVTCLRVNSLTTIEKDLDHLLARFKNSFSQKEEELQTIGKLPWVFALNVP